MRGFLQFLLGCTLVAIVLGSLAGLALWKTQGMSFYSVQTGSMSPVLQPGDLAVSIKPNLNRLQPGDVISYKSGPNPQKIITHRIYQTNIKKGYLVTKGDNLNYQDPPLAYSYITGKVVKAIPKAGYFMDFLHRPIGLIAIIYLPAILITAYEIHRLASHYQRRTYGALPAQ